MAGRAKDTRFAALGAAVTIIGALLGFVAPAARAQAQASEQFPRVAALSLTNCRPACDDPAAVSLKGAEVPHLLVDAERRTMYAYRNNHLSTAPRGVAVIAMDDLKQVGFIDLAGCKLPRGETPAACAAAGRSGSGLFTTSALDPDGRRLFLGERLDQLGCNQTDVTSNAASCAQTAHLAVVDLTKPNGTPLLLNLPATGAQDALGLTTGSVPNVAEAESVYGLTFDGKANRLYVLTASTANIPNNPTDAKGVGISAYDASTLTAASKPLWTYRVRPCGTLLRKNSGPAYFDLGNDNGQEFLYAACKGAGNGISTHGVFRVNLAGSPDDFTTEFHPFGGGLSNAFSMGDPAHDRIAIGVKGVGRQRLFVFDAAHRSWVASALLGDANIGGGGTDTVTGRMYVLNNEDGIRYVDASALPAIIGKPLATGAPLLGPDPAVDPVTRRVFVPMSSVPENLWVYEDRTPAYSPPAPIDPDDYTHQIPEADAATVTHTAGASAYGMRTTVVGGVASVPFGPFVADLITATGTNIDKNSPEPSNIGSLRPEGGDRGLFLGQVQKAQLEGDSEAGTATATAGAVRLDDATRTDLESKYGFALERTRLAESAPAYSALAGNVDRLAESSCSDLGATPATDDHEGSDVSCTSLDRVQGWASGSAEKQGTQASSVGPVTYSVAEAESQVDVVKSTSGGVSTVAKAVARGITVTVPEMGTLKIGEIVSEARSRASGRDGAVPALGAESSLVTEAKNVRILDAAGKQLFSCGVPVADAKSECNTDQLVVEINRLFAQRVQARGPRQELDDEVTGSDGGAQAIVRKDNYAYWSDLNVMGDAMREVTGLELIVYNDSEQPSRLRMEFAGVYAESQYQIGAPKEVDEDGPTRLSLELVDGEGEPLAGGVFQVTEAASADDPLAVPVATCTTGDDGVGDCEFEGLEPGDYVVTEKVAPPGYAAAEPASVTLDPGYESVVNFTNLRAVGAIGLVLSDDGAEGLLKPLEGAQFTVLSDNGDLVKGPGDTPYADCTTDADGACLFEDVPLGPYVVTESVTPEGYLTADDVGFVLEQPGQAAGILFVTGLLPIEATEGEEPTPTETARVDEPTDTSEVVLVDPPMQSIANVTSRPLDRGGRSIPERIADLPADIARFLVRKPWQALLFGLMWVVFGLPAYLATRRRTLMLAKEFA